jgi:isopentenyl diphosphate isomerase/L-lactate dehydrogenase-like FMN-dependent dehydrogenase
VLKDISFTLNFIKRVEQAGYTGLVLTVDAPILGYRERDFQINFKFPDDIEPVNLLEVYNSDVAKRLLEKISNSDNQKLEEQITKTGKASELFMFFTKIVEDSITWDFIEFLRQNTKLKIILKGIHRADDALKAESLGVDAIMISNHGGRQIDTVPSSIEMLYAIKKALGKNSKMELYLDGGIRRGSDIFKALALGAKAVFIGRPVLWGLAAGGEEGIKRVLDFLRNEFFIVMKLAGCKTLSDINEDYVRFTNNFAKF